MDVAEEIPELQPQGSYAYRPIYTGYLVVFLVSPTSTVNRNCKSHLAICSIDLRGKCSIDLRGICSIDLRGICSIDLRGLYSIDLRGGREGDRKLIKSKTRFEMDIWRSKISRKRVVEQPFVGVSLHRAKVGNEKA